MRCERQSATISTSACLMKQNEVLRYVKTRRRTVNGLIFDIPNAPAHCCYKCHQGTLVKKGELNDMDLEEIKEKVKSGIAPIIIRTCSKCKIEKEVSQFMGSNSKCRKCTIADSRARMKEVNSKEQEAQGEPVFVPAKDPSPVPAERILSVEIAGHRINLCPECARRYLKI